MKDFKEANGKVPSAPLEGSPHVGEEFEPAGCSQPSSGAGSARDERDVTSKQVRRRVQLEDTRLYFLSIFMDEGGRPLGKYSFDVERADDYHYEFDNEGAAKLLELMGADPDRPLATAMVEYLEEHDGRELDSLVSQVKTHVHYYY